MGTSYTEEEFKTLLKNLFIEKKRVRELKKQLSEADLGQGSLKSSYEQLKSAYEDKEKEVSTLQAHLEQIRPMAKRLAEELKKMRQELKEKELSPAIKGQTHPDFETAARKASSEYEKKLEVAYGKLRELSKRNAQLIEEKEKLYQELEGRETAHKELQQSLGGANKQIRELQNQLEESMQQIRQTQILLGKKVKEAALLSDLGEKQKEQLVLYQQQLRDQAKELDHLREVEMELKKGQDEKVEVAQAQVRAWKEKCLALEEGWEEQKGELLELQKMRKTYAQMATTFSSLKHLIDKEDLAPKPPQETYTRD